MAFWKADMKLFFETGIQATNYLLLVLCGMIMAFGIDCRRKPGVICFLVDIMVLVAAGFSLLIALVFCKESTLRLYHLLGAVTGALLYEKGVGKIIRYWRCRQD